MVEGVLVTVVKAVAVEACGWIDILPNVAVEVPLEIPNFTVQHLFVC